MRRGSGQRQKGVSLSGLLVWSVILVTVSILGMKLVPVYKEYASIRKNLIAIASDSDLQAAPPAELRQSFDRRAQIDDIKTVRGKDLEIRHDRGQIVLSVEYSVKTPLVANTFLCIDFHASSKK